MAWLVIIALLFIGAPIAAVALAAPLPGRKSLLLFALALAVLGGMIGFYCSFWVRWQPSPTLRYLGFPFPAMIWQLENGEWVDYVGTPITAAMNIALFSGVGSFLSLILISLQRLRQRAGKTHKVTPQANNE